MLDVIASTQNPGQGDLDLNLKEWFSNCNLIVPAWRKAVKAGEDWL